MSRKRPQTRSDSSQLPVYRHLRCLKSRAPGSCRCNPVMGSHLTYEVVSTLRLPSQGNPTVVSINPEGTFIAVGCADGSVLVWRLRSYELLCQTSPPLNEQCAAEVYVTNMTWMSNGLLVFSRKNGLMSMLLIGKVRRSTGHPDKIVYSLLPSASSKLYLFRFTIIYLCSPWLIPIHSTSGLQQLITR